MRSRGVSTRTKEWQLRKPRGSVWSLGSFREWGTKQGRSQKQLHGGGQPEDRSLAFQKCELLNNHTEAVNPHPLKLRACLLTWMQGFGDTRFLVLWLVRPLSFGEDLKRFILKWQAELAPTVYSLLWAQGEAGEECGYLQNGRLREEPGFLVPKTCGMDATVCWSVTLAGGAFHSHALNDTRCFSVVRIFQILPQGHFAMLLQTAVQFYGKEFVFPHTVPNSGQQFFLLPLGQAHGDPWHWGHRLTLAIF